MICLVCNGTPTDKCHKDQENRAEPGPCDRLLRIAGAHEANSVMEELPNLMYWEGGGVRRREGGGEEGRGELW